MDMTDPRWPSLREAARRFLREEWCTLSVPKQNISQAWDLVQAISDHVPERILLPEVVEGELAVVDLAKLGGTEPELNICWVPDCQWNDFYIQAIDLLEAGYPGCVGCGGPGAEGEWDEAARRSQFLS